MRVGPKLQIYVPIAGDYTVLDTLLAYNFYVIVLLSIYVVIQR